MAAAIAHGDAFAGTLRPGDSLALLLVDPVRAYVDQGSPLHLETGAAAVAAMAELLEAFRAASLPVAFTNVRYRKDGSDGGRFFRKVPALELFAQGSELSEFPAALSPRAGEAVVTKQYPSAFFATTLLPWLLERRVDTLVIAGSSTSGCVRASALDALQHGFVPLVVDGACADRDDELQRANLFDIQAKIGEVVGLTNALALVRGT